MTSVAVILWILLAILDVILMLLPPVYVSFTTVMGMISLGLFIAAVVMTVKEENARHDKGERGLGIAGITAIAVNIGLLVINVILSSIMGFKALDALNKFSLDMVEPLNTAHGYPTTTNTRYGTR